MSLLQARRMVSFRSITYFRIACIRTVVRAQATVSGSTVIPKRCVMSSFRHVVAHCGSMWTKSQAPAFHTFTVLNTFSLDIPAIYNSQAEVGRYLHAAYAIRSSVTESGELCSRVASADKSKRVSKSPGSHVRGYDEICRDALGLFLRSWQAPSTKRPPHLHRQTTRPVGSALS